MISIENITVLHTEVLQDV